MALYLAHFLLNTFTSVIHQKDKKLLRLVYGKETPDWDKIRILLRVGETPVHLSSEQIRKHALLLTSETTRHRDLSIELRTFLVMERLKLDSNDNKTLSTWIEKEHSIKMTCQEIGEFSGYMYC